MQLLSRGKTAKLRLRAIKNKCRVLVSFLAIFERNKNQIEPSSTQIDSLDVTSYSWSERLFQKIANSNQPINLPMFWTNETQRLRALWLWFSLLHWNWNDLFLRFLWRSIRLMRTTYPRLSLNPASTSGSCKAAWFGAKIAWLDDHPPKRNKTSILLVGESRRILFPTLSRPRCFFYVVSPKFEQSQFHTHLLSIQQFGLIFSKADTSERKARRVIQKSSIFKGSLGPPASCFLHSWCQAGKHG